MPQITEQQRIQQIRREVEAADKQPPDRQVGFELIQGPGDPNAVPGSSGYVLAD